MADYPFRPSPDRISQSKISSPGRRTLPGRFSICLNSSRPIFCRTVEKIPGGFKVIDANGQSLAYIYSRDNPNDAHMAGVLTEDEARRIASNIAKLPDLLGKGQ
jgi:hypothetical protein